MGKKQHSKDRLFITQKEWKEEFGGKKEKAAYMWFVKTDPVARRSSISLSTAAACPFSRLSTE